MKNEQQSHGVLKPEHIKPARNLALRARMIVEGVIAGLHQSPYHGFSSEFLEFRAYLSGESARKIDWRKYAKSDRTVVRLFEDETNLSAHIFIDKSSSMAFSSTGVMNKYDYAKTLAASLAWILIRQRDAVGIATFDESISTVIPPHSTNPHLQAIISHLEKSEASGKTGCGASLSRLAAAIKKRGLCIIISDLFDDPGEIVRGLRYLRFKKQDVIVLRIIDPKEQRFDYSSPLFIRDMETGEGLSLDAATAAGFFNAGSASHQEAIRRSCLDLRIDYETIVTTEPFQRALLRVLEKRRRMF